MINITAEHLLKLSKYLTILHHSKGRIRVRVNPKIKELKDDAELLDIDIEDIKDIQNKINGIREVKIIPLMGSITINYDNDIFPMNLWEDLITGKNIEQTRDLLNNLAKDLA